MPTSRGADLLARTLARVGVKHLFSLSGNHIMPLYDAALDAGLSIVHTRHEGAAVHMADAWGRLTGQPGVALFTGGPGHANAVGALYTALASESPVVMLSGHAPLNELGKGSFQEMRQAELALPVCKQSWTTQQAEALGDDIARAFRVATVGRPGPVHMSLPFDLLEATVDAVPPAAEASLAPASPLAESAADTVLELLGKARRPLILTGSVLSRDRAGDLPQRLSEAAGVPVVCMESPRGLNDPALGALAGVVAQADFIVLLGKQPDFTLRFGRSPAVAVDCRIALIDPQPVLLKRAAAVLGRDRIALSAAADSVPAARLLVERAAGRRPPESAWAGEVDAALRARPPQWASHAPRADGPVHPLDIGRAMQGAIGSARETVFVSDGGEFGQWAQATVTAPTRIINGVGGSIGSAIPFALAAKMARPDATVIAATGDGACGYHLLELDTAVREGLAPVVVVGNDACWNAEHQIQLRTYGKARAHGCELLPTRYDLAAAALGAHGEHVTRPGELDAALARAVAAGKPALVNVMIERLPAPVMK